MKLHRSLAIAVIFSSVLGALHDSRAAPDNTLGMAIMGAYMSSDGTVRSSSGVLNVEKASAGQYYITFDRDVSRCILSGVAGAASATYLSAYVMDSVDVRLVRAIGFSSSTGSPADVAVHVMVFCPK